MTLASTQASSSYFGKSVVSLRLMLVFIVFILFSMVDRDSLHQVVFVVVFLSMFCWICSLGTTGSADYVAADCVLLMVFLIACAVWFHDDDNVRVMSASYEGYDVFPLLNLDFSKNLISSAKATVYSKLSPVMIIV